MSNIQSQSYTLITGRAASTGSMVDIDKTLENTIYYRFSGLNTGSTVTFSLEARDPNGGWGYIVDTVSLTGAGLNTSIATYNTPITNGVRGVISTISNGSGYIYLDTSY